MGSELFGHVDHGSWSHRRDALGLGRLALDVEGFANERNAPTQHKLGQRTLFGGQLVDERLTMATTGPQPLGPGLGRRSGSVIAPIGAVGTVRWASVGRASVRRAAVSASAAATSICAACIAVTPRACPGAWTARSTPAVSARTTLTALTASTTIFPVEVGEVLLLSAPGELGGDAGFLAAAAHNLNAFRLGATLLFRGCHRDDDDALKFSLSLSAQDVANLHLRRQEGAVHDAFGLTGPGGTPRPGAVTPFTCEFDVDAVRHRAANLPVPVDGGRMTPR